MAVNAKPLDNRTLVEPLEKKGREVVLQLNRVENLLNSVAERQKEIA